MEAARLWAARPEAIVSPRSAAVLLPAAEAPWWARCAAAVGRSARHSGVAMPAVVAAVAVPAEELDAAVAEVRRQAAAHAAGLRSAAERAAVAREAAGVSAVVVAPLREAVAVSAAAAVPLWEAVAEPDEAVPPLAEVRVEAAEEAGLRRAAPGGVAARREAVASVYRPDRLLPWPAP